MYEVIRTISVLFKKRKINNFPPLRSFSARKKVAFVVLCSFSFVLLVGFGSICVFMRSRFFCKKKKKKKVIFLITLFTTLLMCTPINPPIENLLVRTYFYLWSSVRIFSFYEDLFKSFLTVRIFWNLYHLCESMSLWK